MPGMYPENQTLEIFGKTVEYPGVDKNGKFTNGSFSDPDERPSFIPAETINLILDNIGNLITALGKNPDNNTANQLALAITDALAMKQSKIIIATCATAANTAAKVVTINNYTLTAGDLLAITYTLGNTANAATINVNSVGAKAVSLGGGAPTAESGYGAHYIAANRTAIYFYNGTYFCLLGNQDITDADTTVGDGTISTAKIADNAVTTAKITDKNVTTDKLADTAVTTAKITDKNVTTGKLADTAVTTAKITDKNVTTDKLADTAVTTAKITDKNVTTDKLADTAVTTAKITDKNVTTDKLADTAVTTAKITDKNVTTAKIADKGVTTDKIADVTADTTSTKAAFSATAVTYAVFIKAVWQGITWLNGKLHASTGHKHTGGTDDAPRITYTDLSFPIGKLMIQLPSEPSPDGLYPGTWELWNTRPEIYGLINGNPSYETYNSSNTSIAAGVNRLVTHADGDKVVYTSKQAITGNPIGEFNPAYWNPLSGIIFVARNKISGHSWNTDLTIGSSVTYNGVSTYKVVAIHNLGGKFLSIAGGNRPTFESGGVYGDMIRDIIGTISNSVVKDAGSRGTGALRQAGNSSGSAESGTGSGFGGGTLTLDASLIVPTGNENSPRTLSVNYWRRIS